MSFLNSVFCCCKTSSPIDSCNDSTAMWKSDSNTNTNVKLLDVFEKSEIRFFGLFEERIENKPYDMSLFSKDGIKKIVFGKNHIVILLINNKLATWGSNNNGQLGFPISEPIIPELRINNLTVIKDILNYKIVDLDCCEETTYLVLEDLKTLRRKIVRLGIEGKDKYHLDKDVRSKKYVFEESFNSESYTIDKIVCSKNRIIVTTKQNVTFIKGMDFEINFFNEFTPYFKGYSIKQLCLGLNHILFLTTNNELYGLGSNDHGELGLINDNCEDENCNKPVKIKFFLNKNILKIATGFRHSLVLTEPSIDQNKINTNNMLGKQYTENNSLENSNNKISENNFNTNNKDNTFNDIYSFGDNAFGQCTGFDTKQFIPKRLFSESEFNPIDIYSGCYHSFTITSEGDLFSWGDNSYKKLGYSSGSSVVNIPKKVPYLKGYNVGLIGLGEHQSILLTLKKKESIVDMYYRSTRDIIG